jgi:hypothetical protein
MSMPSFVRGINIGSMDNGSIVITKNTALISPKSVSSQKWGSGTVNTANSMRNFNAVNSTNIEKPHAADQNIAGEV